MLHEYRLEEIQPQITADIKRKKDEQKRKEEDAWKDELEESITPPAQQTGDSFPQSADSASRYLAGTKRDTRRPGLFTGQP